MASAKAPAGVRDVDLYEGLFVRWMGRLEADLPMITEIARRTGGPVLEVGVGAGRVALHLAREGIAVTGVDDAPAMLAALRERLRAEPSPVRRRVRVLCADARAYRATDGRRHALALLPFNTLMHFTTLEDQDAVLRAAALALAPRGYLWISLFNPDAFRPAGVMRAEPSPLWGEAEGLPGSRTEAFFQQRFDFARQIAHVRYWLDTVGTDGLVRRQTTELSLRWFHRFELERLLRANGFAVHSVFGDFDGSDYADGSPQLIVLARRAGRGPR
jgi:SAM-dependent methyltransferase